MSTGQPHFYTTAEVAAMLRMTPEWVAEQCRRGRLGAIKAGKEWRIPPAAYDEFVTPRPPSPPPTRRNSRQRRW